MLRRTAGFGIIPKMLAARRTYPGQADSQWRPPCAAFAHRRTRGEARLQSRQVFPPPIAIRPGAGASKQVIRLTTLG
jgi:hypothetical protein